MEKYHIFENIVKDENSFTELTYNLLQYKVFRDAFIKMLSISNNLQLKNIEFSDFDTQYGIGKYGRPDLTILNDDVEILIEIKTYDTGRTKNQPKNYLKYLTTSNNKKAKAVIFLLPYNYYDIYGCDIDFKKFNKSNPNSKIITGFAFWQDLTKEIETQELHLLFPILSEYHKLLKQWYISLNTIFNLNDIQIMFSSQIPHAIRKITDYLYEIRNELKKQGFNLKDSNDKYFEEHGFYFKDSKSNNVLFLGCWLQFWEENGYPIILSLESDDDKNNIEKFLSICKSNNLNHYHYKTEEYDSHIIFFDKEMLINDSSGEVIKTVKLFKEFIK